MYSYTYTWAGSFFFSFLSFKIAIVTAAGEMLRKTH